ncbi:RNA-binding protein [Ramlibacter sp. PS3R-8]|uniref:RNA recognition motif domain-containing protein n=1 Tax=Ramlibacter sp. PS3R-8 TaxID=3133437 RepID=UPI0030AF8A2B
MARLLLGNLAPGTTDEEIRDFLVKYGFPPFDSIEHEPGDGSRPAVVLSFSGLDATSMFNLQERVHDMFWKSRKLTARIMQDRFA